MERTSVQCAFQRACGAGFLSGHRRKPTRSPRPNKQYRAGSKPFRRFRRGNLNRAKCTRKIRDLQSRVGTVQRGSPSSTASRKRSLFNILQPGLEGAPQFSPPGAPPAHRRVTRGTELRICVTLMDRRQGIYATLSPAASISDSRRLFFFESAMARSRF